MKTRKIIWLMLLPLMLLANPFTLENRANIWIEEGGQSRSFSINGWSHDASIVGTSVQVGGENISGFSSASALRVLVNDTPKSLPQMNTTLPVLSLVGLDEAIGVDMNGAMLSLSPDGGEFNRTVAVTFTLSAPAGTVGIVQYNIDSSTDTNRTISVDSNSSFTIYLAENGEHNVSYRLSTEPNFRVAQFIIDAGSRKRDSDGDGIPDVIEAEIGLDPFSNVIPDSDKDGWNDWEEYLRGTSDNNSSSVPQDTDGDGWSDWDEAVRDTNSTDPRACANRETKPTADSLYGVEYRVVPSVDINFFVDRISFVNIKSHKLYDTTALLETNASKASQQQLCSADYVASSEYVNDYNLAFNAEFKANLHAKILDSVRVPATISVLERFGVYDSTRGEEEGATIYKNWMDGVEPLTLQMFLLSDIFGALGEDYNASDFRDAFESYLRNGLLVEVGYTASKESSIEVAWIEAAMRSRIESNTTLIVGNPDFSAPSSAFENTFAALSSAEKTFNDLYADIVAYILNSTLVDVEAAWSKKDENSTEQRIANFIQNEESLFNNRYIVSLMTLTSYVVPDEDKLEFLNAEADSDEDGLKNITEVMGVDYTLPTEHDSDHDGVSDKDDPCPNSDKDSCLNDSLSQEDTDKDGIVDAIDNCPYVANPEQESTLMEDIGDACAKEGIAMVLPRTNITLFQGDRYLFEGRINGINISDVFWTVDGKDVSEKPPSLVHEVVFDEAEVDIPVCIGYKKGEIIVSCIEVTVLPREYTHHPVIHSAPALEGNTGTRSMLIEVYLDEPVFTQTTYPYETIAVTATEGEDYTPIHGVIVFNAGENRQYLRVPIIGDTTFEDDEIFILRVGNVESDPLVILNDDADIPDPLLGITLFDSDGLALENMSVLEADVDKNITIRLALSTPARKSGTSVHCTLAPIKNRPIVIGDTIYTEYHSMVGEFVSRDIEFAIGEQVKEVNVTILGDTINESNKSFTIRLSDAMNIRLYNTSSIILPGGTTEDTRNIDIMILDDDPLPEVGFENATYNISEGKILDAKLILSEKSYQNIEINITIGENSTATQEEDYNLSIVNIVIPATAPNATTDNVTSIIEVNTSKGLDGEGDETLILDIDSVKNASKAEDKNSTTITIQEVDTSSPIEGKAFVSMKDATHGTELWSTNGTAVGTGLFIDLATDANSSNPRLMTRVGSLLYFVATDDSYHEKLFVTDGTASGTVELASFSDAYLSDMITVDGKLYFAAANSVTNVVELWKSEGTNSTTAKLIDIYNGYEWMSGQMVVLGEHIYFPSNVSSEEYDIELYTYDTVSNILSLVKDIKEGTEGSNIMRLTVVDDLLYFMANSNEVWKSNGTEANTVLVHTDLAGAYITRLSYLNDMIYFSVNSSSGSMVKSLSKSSDTVSEIATYTEDNIGILTVTTDRVYYTTSPNTSGGEYRLYSISGTTSASVGLLSSYASKTRSLGSYLYVQQSDGLYSSDGTSIVNVKPLASGESIDFAVESLVDELLFHVKNYSAGTVSLWKTNGSAVGTVKLAP